MKLETAVALGLLGLCASGCALFGGGACESGYRFPEHFDAVQVIRVEQKGELHQFLASVRRVGGDYEFAMLDPVFQRPLVEASFKNGEYSESRSLPEEAKTDAKMLFESIRKLFAAECFSRGGRGLQHTGSRFIFDFEEPDSGLCGFPREIHLQARGGFDVEVTAVTEDVICSSAP